MKERELSVEDNAIINYLQEKSVKLNYSLNQVHTECTYYLNLCAIKLGIEESDLKNWDYIDGMFKRKNEKESPNNTK